RRPGPLACLPRWEAPRGLHRVPPRAGTGPRRPGRLAAIRAGLATPGGAPDVAREPGDRRLPARSTLQRRGRDPAGAVTRRDRGHEPRCRRIARRCGRRAASRRPAPRPGPLQSTPRSCRRREPCQRLLRLTRPPQPLFGQASTRADATSESLKAQLRQLRLPTMGREFEKLARDAAAGNQTFIQFLLRLTELELATRATNAVAARIKDAGFPVEKDFDTYDFSAMPQLSKPRILELARCEWITQRSNCCLVGSHGTGKTHISIGLGLAACRAGLRVRFFTAAELVSRLEKEQKQYTLDRFLAQLDRAHLLICDELGYVTMSRGGVELLFRVFADRYERGSILVTSNLPFSEWGQVFQGERMTAALLDRLCHHCHIFEMNGESYRFRESMKTKKAHKGE